MSERPVNEEAVREALRRRVAASEMLHRDWAEEHDLHPVQLSAMLTGRRPVSPRIADMLGFDLKREWVRRSRR